VSNSAKARTRGRKFEGALTITVGNTITIYIRIILGIETRVGIEITIIQE
jgi:hypothetical protein